MKMAEYLLENITDERRKAGNRPATVIFAPVGDIRHLDPFVKHVKKLGLDKMQDVDFLFIYRAGLPKPDLGFSAVHAFEKYPLGTAGAFFAGQAYGYTLGYETIIVADCDAFLDSRKTFDAMLAIAQREDKVVSTPAYTDDHQEKPGDNTTNGWGFMPRSAFEKAGFSTPYTWKGGDDFEIAYRLNKTGLRRWYSEGKTYHPASGYTIYHRISQPQKYYPYACGVFKSLLFIGDYDPKSYAKYLLWYVFNYFFGVAFCEESLKKIVQNSGKMALYEHVETLPNSNFAIEKGKGWVEYRHDMGYDRYLFIPKSLLLLLVAGRCQVHDDVIVLKMPRVVFALRLIWAAILAPIAALMGLASIAGWQKERKKVIYPIMPSNLDAAAKIFATLVEKKSL